MNCTAFGLGTGIVGLATYAWLKRHDPGGAGRNQPVFGGNAEPGGRRSRRRWRRQGEQY